MSFLEDYLNGLTTFAEQYKNFVGSNLVKLGNFIAGSAPSSQLTGYSAYIPPFTGGQCNTSYRVNIILYNNNGAYYGTTYINVNGRIIGLFAEASTVIRSFENNAIVTRSVFNGISPLSHISSVIRLDGLADNCGNLPNPNPVDSQSNPYPTGGSPNFGAGQLSGTGESLNNPNIINPIAPKELDPNTPIEGNFLGVVVGILRIIKIANDILDLLNKLLDLFNRLIGKEKEKELRLFPIGTVTKDGYIDISSIIGLGFIPIKLNIFTIRIPNYLSKQISEKSPFKYFNGIGNIMFIDGFYSIQTDDSIQFIKQSLQIPPDSIGFYYHFGLADKITAQLYIIGIKKP